MQRNKEYELTPEAYKAFFDALYSPLCLFANKYLNNLEASKDIVQDVFVKVWEENIRFQNEHTIKSFLYTSVRNRSLNLLKSKPQQLFETYSLPEFELLESDSFFFREVFVAETGAILDKAVSTLPYKCAQIIKLSLKDYSNAEIAEELAISINTVKTQKKIAYQKLRPLLKESLLFVLYLMNS